MIDSCLRSGAEVNAKRNLLLHRRARSCDLADMDTIKLPQRMLAWREHRGLLQQQVANPVGWTRQAIAQIERGKSDITVAKLAIICRRAFHTDLCTFFGPLPRKRAAA